MNAGIHLKFIISELYSFLVRTFELNPETCGYKKKQITGTEASVKKKARIDTQMSKPNFIHSSFNLDVQHHWSQGNTVLQAIYTCPNDQFNNI